LETSLVEGSEARTLVRGILCAVRAVPQGAGQGGIGV